MSRIDRRALRPAMDPLEGKMLLAGSISPTPVYAIAETMNPINHTVTLSLELVNNSSIKETAEINPGNLGEGSFSVSYKNQTVWASSPPTRTAFPDIVAPVTIQPKSAYVVESVTWDEETAAGKALTGDGPVTITFLSEDKTIAASTTVTMNFSASAH